MTEGLLIIDKPAGITSHDVVNRVRRISGIRRVGHAGTLDPLATGVLLVCVGRATRLSEYLIGQSKTYTATVRLGEETNTYDAEGEVTAVAPTDHLTPHMVEQALTPFRGEINQTPPIYSAIKKNGQPLYKLARAGQTVDIPSRQVTIYELELLACDLPDVDLRVRCSSGTYIRSLAHDLGAVLGCGGHITALRRTAISEYGIEDAITLDGLAADDWRDYLKPMDTAVAHLPAITVTDEQTAQLYVGQAIPRQPSDPDTDLIRTYDKVGQFIGLLINREDNWQPKKIFHPLEANHT